MQLIQNNNRPAFIEYYTLYHTRYTTKKPYNKPNSLIFYPKGKVYPFYGIYYQLEKKDTREVPFLSYINTRANITK